MNIKPRARDLGIPFEGTPGNFNAITDVDGIEVGYSTVIEGHSARTGVTIIHPRGKRTHDPVFAGWFPLNGNGEMTGTAWIDEGGFLEGPIGITNTHNVGTVRDAIIHWQASNNALFQLWSCPVVAETADGWLNDMNSFHVKASHVLSALESASGGLPAEGNVGGGTGMICYEFKGGTGSSSRLLPEKFGAFTVGVLVQANFGRRFQLSVAGVPVGQHLTEDAPWTNGENPLREQGSIIIIVATDAPLLPHQLKRIAKRASLGLARTGGMAGNGSGDIFLAFSTANPGAARSAAPVAEIKMLPNESMDPLFWATAYATEEAIINALVAAETMTGRDHLTIPSMPHQRLRQVLRQYNRLIEQ
jgi:L-aminopeptidase/D-esterase-like protein